MAPHALRSCYNSEDTRRISTAVSNSGGHRDVTHSIAPFGTIGKEDFFKSMGLRMKRVYYDSFFDNYEKDKEAMATKKRKINIPAGIRLRECSIVIQGVMCKICRRNFKCHTDLTHHLKWRHFVYSKSTTGVTYFDRSIESGADERGTYSSCFPVIKHKKKMTKMRIVLKLGNEIMAHLSVKRKHLKLGMANATTQTDECLDMETEKYKNTLRDYSVPNTDTHKCSAVSIRTDQVLDHVLITDINSNDIPQKRSSSEDSAKSDKTVKHNTSEVSLHHINGGTALSDTRTANHAINTSNDSEVSTNSNLFGNLNMHNELSFSMTVSSTYLTTRVSDSKTDKSTCLRDQNQTYTMPVQNPMKDVSGTHNNLTTLTSDNPLPKEDPTPTPLLSTQRATLAKNSNYINNISQTANRKSATQILPNSGIEIRPNVFMRPVPPIHEQNANSVGVPNIDGYSSTRASENRISPLSESQQKSQTKDNSRIQSVITRNPECTIENNTKPCETTKEVDRDDEIQEVLWITRERVSDPNEINHESPNREQREKLQLMDAITDMMRMEERGVNLLAQNTNTKKSPVNLKSDHKKKSQKANARQDSSFAVVKASNAEKQEPSKSERSEENIPKPSHNISLEDLQRYNINYYNESPEKKNVSTKTSQHSHRWPEPESEHNKSVILIDLSDD